VVGSSLRLRLVVSTPSRARLRLLQRGVRRGQKLVGLHAGANGLRLALPPTLKAGSYRLELVIWAGGQHSTTVIQLDRKR
jgi:hypothetical protein